MTLPPAARLQSYNRRTMLTLAVSKGKIFDAALPVLQRIGIDISREDLDSRRLIMESGGLRIVSVRGPDVVTYVGYGAIDAGIVGNDLIEELDPDDISVLADLGISRCRLIVAAPGDMDYAEALRSNMRLGVATKYPRLARRHFAGKDVQVGIVKLYGSMEIAPATGLADVIVDLTDTGRTLRENGLVEQETVMDVSSRLVCNTGSLKKHRTEILRLRERLMEAAGA